MKQAAQLCMLWSSFFVTLRPNSATGFMQPRSVPRKAFCNYYKNVDVHDYIVHTQILRSLCRVHLLYDNNAGK